MPSPCSPQASAPDPILAAALDALITIDERGCVVELNPAAEQLFGYRRDDALGRPLAELVIPPRSRAAHRAGLNRLLSGAPSELLGRRVEMSAMRADGGELLVETRVIRTAERPPRFSGWIRELTQPRAVEAESERRGALLGRAELEIEALVAVSEAMTAWETLETGAERLLHDLAAPLGYEVGVLWLPQGDVLVPRLFCSAASIECPEFERATRKLRLPCGVGLPGRAWERRQPIGVVSLSAEDVFARHAAARHDGLAAGVAIPALAGDEVLAVVELCSRQHVELDERLMRSLTRVGYDLGFFLARRRHELEPPALTPRQLEILRLLADGSSNRQIAARLNVGRTTVNTHVEHIYEKLGVSKRPAAVAHALRIGLIQ